MNSRFLQHFKKSRVEENIAMSWLNYHHFYYFWIIAQEMSVTRAAKRLRLSQSNLSAQLKEFESLLGHSLFDRVGQRLVLTESGKIAFDYANEIFQMGQEMMDHFEHRPIQKGIKTIRVGAMSSLSQNLQIEFLSPLLKKSDVKLVALQGSLPDLVRQLKSHILDVVISNTPIRGEEEGVYSHPLAEIPVFLVGVPGLKQSQLKFPESLNGLPLYLPAKGSQLRSECDAWLDRLSLKPKIKAEVEAMPLLRLFALSGEAHAIAPEIVVRNELKEKKLICYEKLDFWESFYAITVSRKFPNELIEVLVKNFSRRK